VRFSEGLCTILGEGGGIPGSADVLVGLSAIADEDVGVPGNNARTKNTAHFSMIIFVVSDQAPIF
jgi:hypothetical protein